MQSSFGSGVRGRSRHVLIALTAILIAASMAFGQGIVTGSISGTILDQQKAVVSGAKITAKQDGTNVERTTE